MIWGLVSPRDLITAWRATEVLRYLNNIENGTLCAAYHTGRRNPSKSDLISYVKPMIEKIGRDTYNKIMSLPVPDEIIRGILDSQTEEGLENDLDPIIDEVRAGTIKWQQEFSKFGIKHPDEIDAEEKKQEEIIKRFDKLLNSYAESKKIRRNCMVMDHVESALLSIIEKKVNDEYPDNVIVALAGIVGELSILEFTFFISSFIFIDKKERDLEFERTIKKEIEYSTEWLISNSKPSWFSFLRKKKVVSFTSKETIKLLEELLNKHFPRKNDVSQ
jgi:hypothetical protein